jgi:hypothetical protein
MTSKSVQRLLDKPSNHVKRSGLRWDDFEAALMRKSLDTEARNYSIVEAKMVAGHAHMIPIFTEDGPDPSIMICFYDDLMTLV